jgi:ABC-type polysaccharide/polyol phosphate export permease
MILYALWLGVRRNVASIARYPLGMINLTVLSPLYKVILPSFLLGSAFVVGGHARGFEASTGTNSYQGFLFLGGAMNILLVGTLIGATTIFTVERAVGTLEQSWTVPAPRARLSLETVLSGMAIALIGTLGCIIVGVAFFGVSISPRVVFALPAIGLDFVGIIGLTFLMLSLQLWLRTIRAAVDGLGIACGMLSGNVFPVSDLPGPMLVIAHGLPMTYGTDLLRHYALGARLLTSPLPEYGLETLTAGLLLAAGCLAYHAATRRALQTGDAGQP